MASRQFAILGMAMTMMTLGGCAIGTPHVLNVDEFNRDASTFNKPLTDRDNVTICYNPWFTKKAEAVAMGEAACAAFDKRAVATGKSFGECPMANPIEMIFDCEAVTAASEDHEDQVTSVTAPQSGN